MADHNQKLVVRNALTFMGARGVSRPSLICDTSNQKMISPTIFLRPKLNFSLLTVRRLDMNVFLS